MTFFYFTRLVPPTTKLKNNYVNALTRSRNQQHDNNARAMSEMMRKATTWLRPVCDLAAAGPQHSRPRFQMCLRTKSWSAPLLKLYACNIFQHMVNDCSRVRIYKCTCAENHPTHDKTWRMAKRAEDLAKPSSALAQSQLNDVCCVHKHEA